MEVTIFAKQILQSRGIIFSALSVTTLRVVRYVIGKSIEILKTVDALYESKTTASNITKIVDLVSILDTNQPT